MISDCVQNKTGRFYRENKALKVKLKLSKADVLWHEKQTDIKHLLSINKSIKRKM